LNTPAVMAQTIVNGEEADTIFFTLDGDTYTTQEDPSDGYRSYLAGLYKEDGFADVVQNLERYRCLC